MCIRDRPDAVEKLQLETQPLKRAQFFSRVRDEITKRGIIDVLRRGVKVYPASLVPVSYTHLDVYKRQSNAQPDRAVAG